MALVELASALLEGLECEDCGWRGNLSECNQDPSLAGESPEPVSICPKCGSWKLVLIS
jgi:hypothetical protein